MNILALVARQLDRIDSAMLKEDFDLFMTLTLMFNPIDPKIYSNGPRIISNHPTKFLAIRFNIF